MTRLLFCLLVLGVRTSAAPPVPAFLPQPVLASFSPVELRQFTATASMDGVRLYWNTGGAPELERFEIECSSDGRQFGQAGERMYQEGQHHFEFVHDPGNAPMMYYRLRLVGPDGTFSFSPVISVRIGRSNPLVFPNPASGAATLQFYVSERQRVGIRIVDGGGREVVRRYPFVEAGMNSVPLGGEQLPAGVYTIQVVDAQGKFLARLRWQVTR